MESLKKILGIVWIILALLAAYFCIAKFGLPKILSGHQEDVVFGIIILFILTPIISCGLAFSDFTPLPASIIKKRCNFFTDNQRYTETLQLSFPKH